MSPRARTALIVGAVAVAAAIAVAGAATLGAERADSPEARTPAPEPRPGSPPFALALGFRDDVEARALREAASLYDEGKVEEARAVFLRHDSLEAKLGAAFAAWPASKDRIEQIGALYPRSALVQLHVGLARLWAGVGGAESAWREARDVEPDTPYAIRANDLLHPGFAPGQPTFVPSFAYSIEGVTAQEQFESLRDRADLRGRLLYGVFLQRLERPVSARRAFAAALARAPADVDALVAEAVGRYDKGNPSAAFSRLGPLSRRFPEAATVRLHLGLLLLWQKDVDEGKRQFELARTAEPGSIAAREAGRFLDELESAGTG